MKKLLFIAAVIPFIAAVATDEPQKDPAAEAGDDPDGRGRRHLRLRPETEPVRRTSHVYEETDR